MLSPLGSLLEACSLSRLNREISSVGVPDRLATKRCKGNKVLTCDLWLDAWGWSHASRNSGYSLSSELTHSLSFLQGWRSREDLAVLTLSFNKNHQGSLLEALVPGAPSPEVLIWERLGVDRVTVLGSPWCLGFGAAFWEAQLRPGSWQICWTGLDEGFPPNSNK